MTCRECRHWEQCVLPDGTAKYYGTENACGNVEKLCKWYIQKGEPQRWIPVTERLPEVGRCVIIHSIEGGIAEGMYTAAEHWVQFRWYSKSIDVTHWMPLPEPPKEDA